MNTAVLIDTSIWVDHLRDGNAELARLLDAGLVTCHPFVIGEVSLGRLRKRAEILSLLESLPHVPHAAHEEVLIFIDAHDLAGSGIGWVDAHLLCAARLASVSLWTADRHLSTLAARLGLFGSHTSVL